MEPGTGDTDTPAGGGASILAEDSLRLTLPADPDYARVARSLAAGLALRLGFAYGEIEELRLAVDEVLILLLRGRRSEGSVVLTFVPTTDGIELDARALPPPDGPDADEMSVPGAEPEPDESEFRARFEELVSPIVDAWSIGDEGLHVHLSKHSSS